jgi:hypothetical protein
MAHFNQASHTASDALSTSGMRSLLEATIPVLPEAEQNCLSAKQRRLSRPNKTEELRLKRRTRNKKLREKCHKESGNAKQRHLTNKVKSQIDNEIRPQHLSYDRGQCIILFEKVERRMILSYNDRLAVCKYI